MNEEELRIRQLMHDNFAVFAEHCLKIRSKSEGIVPLRLNKAQLYINSRLDLQKKEKGRVRAYILKGRQQGCSTLIAARYYWLAIHNVGYKVYILSHLADATRALFKMVKRYHDGMPDFLKPATLADSAKELVFLDIDSGYSVGTARSTGGGRGETIQLFHGSEVAFWEDAENNAGAAIQTISGGAGTEIVMESTANGVGNYFHAQCMDAQAGLSDYQLIFVPFFWQDEYSKQVGLDFSLDSEEKDIQQLYGVSNECLAWRRDKIKELGSEWRFKQEYPFSVDEAFQSSGRISFIRPEVVERARKLKYVANDSAPIVMGVDPALGGDRTSIVLRKGVGIVHIETLEKLEDFTPTLGRIVALTREWGVKHIFVDSIGIGFGIVDNLRRMGYEHMLTGVNVALQSFYPDKYFNKRAEIWDLMRQWLEDGGIIPDRQSLCTDLLAPAAGHKAIDFKGRLKIQSKEDIKKDGFRSPDEADALALTFAHSVIGDNEFSTLGNNLKRRKNLSII